MSIKTVVRHDTSQIRVVCEQNAEHIVYLALIPVGTIVEIANGWNGSGLVGVGLHTDARVVANGEQVVDDLEALVAGWVVDSGDIGDLSELGSGVVLEERKDGDDAGRRDVDGELILPNREPS